MLAISQSTSVVASALLASSMLYATAQMDTATAQGVRLQALVSFDGTLVRGRGVASVSTPSVGVFCIRPKTNAGIDVDRIIPVVGLAESALDGDDLAKYIWPNVACPATRIEVRTFDHDNGNFIPSNEGFSIIVP